jgi:hypothetical protein
VIRPGSNTSVALAAIIGLAPFAARADEGLWTFERFPAAKVKAAYGVDITPAWRAKVQAASVRLSIGCSGAVVSPNGLVFTNSHCVTDCAQAVSPKNADYFADGFLAASAPEEKACPGLEAEILQHATDVTDRLRSAIAGRAASDVVRARNAAVSAAEREGCGDDPRLRCEVITLYQAGRYALYKYRVYRDVRLVFTPSAKAAFFGGDPDNFNFPRYDLDVAFLRLYEDGKPVATHDHLAWNPTPPTPGEPVFVPGNPGPTARDATLAQLAAQRDLIVPLSMAELADLRSRLIQFSAQSDAHRRAAASDLEQVENDYKVRVGEFAALTDPAFLAAKQAQESEFQAKARARLGVGGLGDPWRVLGEVAAQSKGLWPAYRALEAGPYDSKLFDAARSLVRAAAERPRPSGERLPEFADAELPQVAKGVLDPQPVDPDLEQLMLTFWLAKARERLGADDPLVQRLVGADTPETLARKLVAGSKLADPAVRKALWDGGAAAIAASDDPMLRFVARVDPDARRLRAGWEAKIAGPTAIAESALAQARFALYGEARYPDGTLSLRLSYGAVEGWTDRGQTTGPFTTFAGLYQRATGQPPYDLDPKWIAAQGKLDPGVIFNFTTNNDIVGGNSGSPVLNANTEVIGAAFDGNIHSIGGDYWFDPVLNRAVAVSAAAVTEALRTVYGASALLAELGAH